MVLRVLMASQGTNGSGHSRNHWCSGAQKIMVLKVLKEPLVQRPGYEYRLLQGSDNGARDCKVLQELVHRVHKCQWCSAGTQGTPRSWELCRTQGVEHREPLVLRGALLKAETDTQVPQATGPEVPMGAGGHRWNSGNCVLRPKTCTYRQWWCILC